MLHAPGDTVVGIENASKLFAAARHPKSFVSLDEADHLLTSARASAYVAQVIAAWSTAYVPASVASRASVLEGVVVVETAGGKFAQNVSTKSHRFLADEPKDFGGNNAGPNPYELLLASLGTCTSMTIRMYADRKGIPLTSVRVELEHGKEHAQDCKDCNGDGSQIDVIDRSIALRGELTDQQRLKLMEIADKCPVHRTLENRIEVRTTAMP